MASCKRKMSVMLLLSLILFASSLFFSKSTYAAGITKENIGRNILAGMVGDGCGKPVTELTDGDTNTSFRFFKFSGQGCEKVTYTFDTAISISGYMYIKIRGDTPRVLFQLQDGSSKSMVLSNTNNKLVYLDLKNVISLTIDKPNTNSDMILSEFEFYEYELSKPKDISDLKEAVTHNSVKFDYHLPKENFSHLKIYRDDKLIAKDINIEMFEDKGLESNKDYNYKFVSVSPEGAESKGIDKKIKTDEPPNLTKPAKPPTPTINPKDGSLIVNLTNYNAGVKIKGYHIVVDGKQVNDSLVTTRSYAVKGLKNGQTHNVQIKAVSFWNVESDLSDSIPGIPQVQVIPDIAFNFGLSDLIESIKNWFSGIWPIVAFSIAIPLAFIVAFNTKKLFLR
ncbi:fibronectin type III domain-containing protein [Bacillus cereus]|uniref:fibronectin type III domain-containing protein n=2 Tax=Bacillaceae TaxID=186817 RepID=UPI000E12446F|nr:fibronectin type III domain protein [Bacillus cereus]